ncbi:hypothetical protein H2200_002661 [Cladophialophora chaetospira]|uniref:HORMA domain-containing protein n=1 Tax=Cladophialophora chaetospira TaxID=386627 RepID=A0AA38XJF0_9EURO|nr:hypothetical protein H2200_002661 [Cladophialophora chaetospira]
MAHQIVQASPSQRSLSQAESLALVQIFLNASLACIAHARELIPWTASCFHTRYIDQIDIEYPREGQTLYSAFQASSSTDSSEGQAIKILTHGGNRSADQILDMLEQGVFEALKRGYLESLYVFITKTSRSRVSIVENYRFVFAYEQGKVHSVQINPMDQVFTLESVHKTFKVATRALLRLLRDLPRLPARRKLGMSLAYNKSCPPLYQPSGFVDRDDFQEGDVEAIYDSLTADGADVVGMLDTGHHQVRVTVNLTHSEAQDSPVDLRDTEMSKQLQAMQKTSSSQSNKLLSTLKGSTPATKRRSDAPNPLSKRVKATSTGERSSIEAAPRVTRASTNKNAQNLEIPMDTELESSHQLGLSVELGAATTTGARLAVSKLAELLVHCYAVQNGKTGDKGDLFDEDQLAEGKIKRVSRSIDIGCECENREGSSGMLFCEVCDKWQHRECYGHDDVSSPCIAASEHFCYTCLLFAGEQKAVDSPLFIVFLRKAVRYLTSQVKPGSRIDETFLQTRLKPPRWSKEVADKVIERLVEEHLLLPRKGRLFEVRSLSHSELHQIQEKCTSPLACLEYLYEVSPAGEDPMKRSTQIMQALDVYARGHDYTTAEGCKQMELHDEFGDRVVRWGYDTASNEQLPDEFANSGSVTPVRRRKISFSRMLINVDCSPSAASMMSLDEQSSRVREYSTDFSTAESTATAD